MLGFFVALLLFGGFFCRYISEPRRFSCNCLASPPPKKKDNVLMSFSNDENQNWTKYFNGVGLTIATYKDNISVFLLCTDFFCVLCFTRLTLIFVLLTCTLLYSITAFHLIAKKTVSTLPGCTMFTFFLELMFS